MAADTELLHELSTAPGPSGHEEPVQEVVRERLKGVAEIQTDVLGDLTAVVNGAGTPRMVVEGHADQIGLVVTHVDDAGFVYFDKIGGVDAALCQGREFVIHNAKGPVAAVGGKRPTHLVPKEERNKVPEIRDQWIDIGAGSRDEALARIAIGDPITFTPSFLELSPDVFAGQALDNRVAIYVMVRALELYAKHPGKTALVGLSAVGEETTFLGARAQALALDADVCVVVDGDFASDQPEIDAKKAGGLVEMGKGPVIARGQCSNKKLFTLVCEVAEAEGIAYQVKAYPGQTQTDTDELQGTTKVANLNIGIPMRYMHSPFEVCRGGDLEAAVRLVAALARRVGDVFAPRYFVTMRG
jgi:endoglucanase